MSTARGELRAREGVQRSAAVWILSRVRLASARDVVASLEIPSPAANCVVPSPTFSRLTLGVTELRRRDRSAAAGPAPAIRFELAAYVGGGRHTIENFRWSPATWEDAGLLVAWAGFPVQGFELAAWQETGEPAEIGLHWVADDQGAPASVTRGTNVAAVP